MGIDIMGKMVMFVLFIILFGLLEKQHTLSQAKTVPYTKQKMGAAKPYLIRLHIPI